MEIKKLLIANRGEIAARIIRTAHELQIKVVVIYSELDEQATHVQRAEEKVLLPGKSLSETYLNIDAIVEAAKSTGADAIHPGYGFLAENPLFAEACENSGITFVGPSAESIRLMGNKIAAREIAIKNDVPITKGITGAPAELLKNYTDIGFPMLIKAAAGGGGKGMRIVHTETELKNALESTASEAANYFGDSTIYIEKFIENPRHIEVQVLGDKQGNMIHLFERECSVQRRHQKVIEEAPSPTLDEKVRQSICNSAVKLSASMGYYNAGTIEFLVDDKLNYYFLEMNTRIQVEHPVTEMITGVDIVKEQLSIAEGKALRFKQEDIRINGHAIESRVYAEDPSNNFMPSPGFISAYKEPDSPQVRVESPSFKLSAYIHKEYDPMISKVITHSADRQSAIELMNEALENYYIHGIKTNIPFLIGMLNHPDYINNKIHTRYIDNHLDDLNKHVMTVREKVETLIPLSAALIFSFTGNLDQGTENNLVNKIGYWRLDRKLQLSLDKKNFNLEIIKKSPLHVVFRLDDIIHKACLELEYPFVLVLDGKSYHLFLNRTRSGLIEVNFKGHVFVFERADLGSPDDHSIAPVHEKKSDSGEISSPMPGRVLKINVEEGIRVKKGELLMVVEAMKMENNIYSPFDAQIDKIMVKQGDNVEANARLVHLTELKESPVEEINAG